MDWSSRSGEFATLPIELDSPAANAVIIILHGLGASGEDLLPLGQALHSAHPEVRVVLPTATERRVTINNGMPMPAWYDIADANFASERQPAGLQESSDYVMSLVRAQRQRGIAADRTAVIGFSQGGALALCTALRNPDALTGVASLSAYLPATQYAAAVSPLSIFMAHGLYDEVVPLAAAAASKLTLAGLGYHVQWHEYAMGHQLSEALIADLGGWLTQLLQPSISPGT